MFDLERNQSQISPLSGSVSVIGDVMLDSYWKGPSNRISPEAPVPVVRITEKEYRAGGAANVALNITALGAECFLVGIVGEDRNAELLEKIVREKGVKPDFILTRENPTITKLRVLSRNQQLLRLDFEGVLSDIDERLVLKNFEDALKKSKVVIFSDYGKGTLASVNKMIDKANEQKRISLVDPKGTDFEKYRGATLLTPNKSEFENVVGNVQNNDDLEQKALELIEQLNLKMLLITRSEEGLSLIRPGKESLHLPTYAREVYDVTGAGDTVIATLGSCLASGMNIETACEYANRAAGIVVGKLGTSSVSAQELFK